MLLLVMSSVYGCKLKSIVDIYIHSMLIRLIPIYGNEMWVLLSNV